MDKIPVSRATVPDPQVLARVAELVRREAGIVLGPEKHAMICSRLRRNVARVGARDLAAYLALLESPEGQGELPELVSALTTNFTYFFRERHHFDFLRDVVMPEMRRGLFPAIRIWSAGCSSGQEPYSIAMALMPPMIPAGAGPRPLILATDIDHAILSRATEAVYTEAEIADVPAGLAGQAFAPVPGGYQLRSEYRAAVEFRQMNLHDRWMLPASFDVIFCRNVVIYFDADAQMALWDKFARQLRPGGWLMVGHSERVPEPLRDRLRLVAPTIYQLHRP